MITCQIQKHIIKQQDQKKGKVLDTAFLVHSIKRNSQSCQDKPRRADISAADIKVVKSQSIVKVCKKTMLKY